MSRLRAFSYSATGAMGMTRANAKHGVGNYTTEAHKKKAVEIQTESTFLLIILF